MPRSHDMRNDETQLYQCRLCQQTILARLPIGLAGEFAHASCDQNFEGGGVRDLRGRCAC